jgi:hypothetical protein
VIEKQTLKRPYGGLQPVGRGSPVQGGVAIRIKDRDTASKRVSSQPSHRFRHGMRRSPSGVTNALSLEAFTDSCVEPLQPLTLALLTLTTRCEPAIRTTVPATCRGRGSQFRAGRRTIALPCALRDALCSHRAAQAAERIATGSQWVDHDLVFCQENGRPIEPRGDRRAWRALLTRSGRASGPTA